MSVLLRNAVLVDCSRELEGDLLIEGGRIAALGSGFSAARTIDCRGKVLMPAFVDLHAHFRDPGLTHKEDIASGSRAAVRGGYTTVNLMANTKPVCSGMDTVRYVRETAAKAGLCDVFQTVSITKDFDGVTTGHIREADPKLVPWLSDDGYGVASTGVMLEAMRLAKERGVGVMLHEEDPALTAVDSYLSEELMTFRDVKLALLTGCRTHFCHVSTMDAMNYIIDGKARRSNITCEVTPHHLLLNDRTDYRVAPPLRGELHRLYLIQCLQNGLIDAIATDHAPHTAQDKENGVNGITGLDLAFSSCYTALVREGHLSLRRLSALMSRNPAAMLNVNKGTLEPGRLADLVLVDPDAHFTVSKEHLASRGKNTPLIGQTLYGEVLMTIKEGEIVYEKAAD